MRIYLILSLLLISASVNAQVKKGDTILILKDRPLSSIKPDYIRTDEWYSIHQSYIATRMSGKKYVVKKVKNGDIYFTSNEEKMNEWTPLRFKADINKAAADSCIVVYEKR